MKKVYDLLNKIADRPSKNEKLALLKSMEVDYDLQLFLRATYEPKINYYMKQVDTSPSMFNIFDPIEFDYDLVETIIKSLNERQYTGHKARDWINGIYNALANEWEKEMLICMIQRDVRSGISVGSINKVFPGLITEVPYMRCCLPKDTDLSKFHWDKGVYSQNKADGMYADVVLDINGEVSITTRAGSLFPNDHFKNLISDIKENFPTGVVIQGELLMRMTDDTRILPRAIGNGKFNTLLQEGELDVGYTPIFQAWDMIPIEEYFPRNKFKTPYSQRFDKLKGYLNSSNIQYIRLIEYKIVYSHKEAIEHYRNFLMRDLEGTVIKSPDADWIDGTSKFQVKMKVEFVCDLKLVGFKASDPKSKNNKTFGSIMFESADDKIKVGVSGLTDKERLDLWNDRDILIGTIHSIKSNGIEAPPSNGGFFSLFLPRYIERRLDKTEADNLEKVKSQYQAVIDSLDELQK